MSWVVEPKSSMVFGDGRSIGNIGGVRSLELPWPSTLSGMVRTLSGSDDSGRFDVNKIPEVKQIQIRGPWLYSLSEQQAYFVTPKDMVWNRDSTNAECFTRTRLQCVQIESMFQDVLIDEHFDNPDWLVGPVQALPEGKVTSGPMFWPESDLLAWLLTPVSTEVQSEQAGLWAFGHDERTHVAIDPSTRTAKDGDLFSTDGVVFTTNSRQDFGIAFTTDSTSLTRWQDKPCFLGGERRLAHLRHNDHQFAATEDLKNALCTQERWRVVLLTPSIFDDGAAPESLFGCAVLGHIVGRPLNISGWDYELRGPKPSRRMVPAGSVYWIDVGHLSVEEKSQMIEQHWMTSCASGAQDQRDGFGIIVFGVGE